MATPITTMRSIGTEQQRLQTIASSPRVKRRKKSISAAKVIVDPLKNVYLLNDPNFKI